MGQALRSDGIHARIADKDFFEAAGCRIVFQRGLEIGGEQMREVRKLGPELCEDLLRRAREISRESFSAATGVET